MQVPTLNAVTQGEHGQYKAVDYGSSPDSTFYAPEDGRIDSYGDSGTCGNRLVLVSGANRHAFCHLEKPLVSVGQNVKRGQPLGVMGYTGYTIPSGPGGRHLHHVIQVNGTYVYPPSLVNESFIKGGDMLPEDQRYMSVRMAQQAEPTASQVSEQTWANTANAITALWNSFGKTIYDNRVNDGDITNMLRFAYQNPNYAPTSDDLSRYKKIDWGWKKLAYDTIAEAKKHMGDSAQFTVLNPGNYKVK